MEIGNFLPVATSPGAEWPAQRQDREARLSRAEQGDTVTFSAEALALARQMYSSAFGASIAWDSEETGEATNRESASVGDYKKLFNEYRGMGLFDEDGASEGAASTEDAASDSASRQTAKLEKQIRDLLEKLETVMSSDMPEEQKEMAGAELQKKISELQSSLAALKRGGQPAPSASV